MKQVPEPARDVDVILETDVLVVGSGSGGLAAARADARTALLDRNGCFEKASCECYAIVKKRFDAFLVPRALGIGLMMIRDAVTSRSVVIDSFNAPSALADNGLNGKVVAADSRRSFLSLRHGYCN